MADGSTAFAHKAGDKVAFKDGRHIRVGYVVSQEEADVDPLTNKPRPDGYGIMVKFKETNDRRIIRWAAGDLKPLPDDEYGFKKGDKVVVIGADGEEGQSGEIVEVAAATAETLEPQYAVMFKDEQGKTQLAWWGEATLSAAA